MVFNLHVSTSAGVADGATEDIWNNIKTKLLKTTEECVAQLGHTVGVVKPGGGMNTWKRSLLPSGKLSRPGRLVKALGHHTMQPNEMPDMQCTMLVKRPTRSTGILTPESSEVYCLANQFRRQNTDVVGDKPIKNEHKRCQWAKTQSRRPVQSTTKGFSMLTGTQTTCLINHQWKARPSQSPLICLRRLSHRWRQAKYWAHQTVVRWY